MFRFAYPGVLVILLVVIALWFAWMWKRKSTSMNYPQAREMIKLAGGGNRMIGRLPLVMRTLVLVLVAFAVARPQVYSVSREIETPGVDIVLCLDTSGSMRALDFEIDGKTVTRLDAVKHVMSGFISKRENDRMGIVVFGEEAFTQAPLTLDKGLLLELVDRMEIGMAGDSTAIGSAIAVGAKRLKDLDAKSRIMILMTDGEHNAGELSPAEAAAAADAFGIKIYTIGVGGTGKAPFQVDTMFGPRIGYYDVSLDEETLRQVAMATGGEYFLASDSERLEEIYDIIDSAEKTTARVKEFFHYDELYGWFLGAALIILGLELALKAGVLGVIP